MFFTTELLSKRDSGIGLLWMAATLGKTSIGKLNRRNILKADITKLCELVAEPAEPLALRLSSNLLVGVVRVYKVKHDIFLSEVTTCFTSLKRTLVEINAAETSAALNLAVGSVRHNAITLAAPEGGIGMNLDFDLGGPIWEDFFAPIANKDHRASPSPGITSQDFNGTETQTSSQRPLYILNEPHAHLLAANDPGDGADPIDLALGLGVEEFDLGLGDDAFGDAPMLEASSHMGVDSPTKQRQKAKPKNQQVAREDMDVDAGPMYAREQSAPLDQFNLDDWAMDIQDSSGFGLPGSGGPGLSSSRQGSRFQSREPQAAVGEQLQCHIQDVPMQVEAGEEDVAPPAAPKKPKKRGGLIQDARAELTDEELISSRNNYMKEQKRLRAEAEMRRQERDAARVVDLWMEGVPPGLNCPALDGFFKQSFKALVNENSHRRKRDQDQGFAAPPLPAKRQKEDTPIPEIGRRVGTPAVDFNWDRDMDLVGGMDNTPRAASVEAPEVGMRQSRPASQARDDVNVSQRSALFPWDNVGGSSSTNGDAGPANLPGLEGDPSKGDYVTVKLGSSSDSGRGSVAPSRLSASPRRFGAGMETFEGETFPATAEERPSQVEVTMERNSSKFLEYARMHTHALGNPLGGVRFSKLVPTESSTAHVAASGFYHTLVLATKSAVRVTQSEPFADITIQPL